MPHALASDYMYEATLAQSYAAGLAGHVNWTMLRAGSNGDDTQIYAKLMKGGPVDWSNAEVALIQNTEAAPTSNGHNFSVVPFVDLFLSLHLGPVHYLPDDYLIFNGLSRRSEGLEQVSASSIDLSRYKAVVADSRNLDARVAALLKGAKVPILWVDDPKDLDLDKLASFLENAGAHVDRKTPAGLQIAVSPSNVLLYRRAGEGGKSLVFPFVKREGSFKLVDESGKTLFSGSAEELREKGVEVELDKWRSLILEIKG